MADKPQNTKCPSCGAQNRSDANRCASCGASIEELKPIHSPERERERRYSQEGFSILWALIALIVHAVLTVAVLVALPRAFAALDFEGYYGMSLAIPVWCLGGLLVGLVSPGKTFVEPVSASIMVAFPTVLYLQAGETVRTMPWFMYIIMACIGVMFTLVGAYIGERIQMGPPPKPAE